MKYYFFDSSEMQEAQIAEAQAGEWDYLLEGEGFGGVQITDEEDSQEDRIIHETLTENENHNFRSLSKINQEELLKDTFKTLNKSILNPDENIYFYGSTGAVAIIDPQLNKFHVVNLGDSEVVHVRCSKETAEARTINILHNPVGEEEKRIKAIPNNDLFRGRLAGDLAVSRAFGDSQFHPYGLIDDPDVYCIENVVSDGEEAFVILASDGLREGYPKGLQNSEIADLVKGKRDQSLGQLANALADAAIDHYSEDNISILTFKFPCKNLNSIVILGVFDGHGGSYVSEYLQKNFMQVFRAKLKYYAKAELDLSDQIAALTIPRTVTPGFDYAASSSANQSEASVAKVKQSSPKF